MENPPNHWPARLPFFYGWLIVAIAFVTMAIGVTGRTSFSLLMPPLLDEFGWDRGLAAGAFSFGFLFSAIVSPFVGRVVDARGPRLVIWTGVVLMSGGLLLAPHVTNPWQLYATLGVAVSGGANLMTYTVHSQFLPHWFVRRRSLAISIAFAGAGVGAVLLLPWLQTIILNDGWRASCCPASPTPAPRSRSLSRTPCGPPSAPRSPSPRRRSPPSRASSSASPTTGGWARWASA